MTDASAGSGRAWSPFDEWLADDPEVMALLDAEADRQSTTLQLIASENFTSPAVLAASGSVLTNKYAEGYPGRRYYGGNQVIDEVEDLARERAKSLFGAEHANVQPHAGAIANLAVYQALLEPGDTVLAMRLDHGGHLTHGSPASITSKIWRFVSYGVTPASAATPTSPARSSTSTRSPTSPSGNAPGSSWPARPPTPGSSTRCRSARSPTAVGARFMFDAAHPAGLIAGGVHPSPVGIADVVTFTTHKTLRGPRGGAILCRPGAGQGDRQRGLPGPAGRSARARDRGQGGGLRGGGAARVPRLCGQVVANAAGPRRGAGRRGLPAGVGRDRQPPGARRPALLRRRAHRQGGPGGPRPGRHHLQPQHHPRRPPLALRHLGPAAGVGRRDHRRAWDPSEMRDDRRADRPDPAPPRRRRRVGRGAGRGARAVRAVPPLSAR